MRITSRRFLNEPVAVGDLVLQFIEGVAEVADDAVSELAHESMLKLPHLFSIAAAAKPEPVEDVAEAVPDPANEVIEPEPVQETEPELEIQPEPGPEKAPPAPKARTTRRKRR